MSPKEHFNISSHIPSLQFVTRLPDSNKGWAKGHVLVSDPWSRSIEGSDKLFQPTRSPEIPSIEIRGHLVEWVEKSSFIHLNKLFDIDQIEQKHNKLLIENNLKTIIAQPKPFMIHLLIRLAPLTLVPGEHFVLKNLPFYEVARLADVEVWQTLLYAQEKKCQKWTLRQAIGSTSQATSSLAPWLAKKSTIVHPQA
uniref:Uncharacterized protein n=1 Tax=Vitis vinifera TaxID=29760 RepID=A5AXP5_VITVI|nr:hypothetical protein VITISV_010895 [Vitis vinifera]